MNPHSVAAEVTRLHQTSHQQHPITLPAQSVPRPRPLPSRPSKFEVWHLKFLWILVLGSWCFSASAQSLSNRLESILAAEPNQWTALVENDDGTAILFEHTPNSGLAPASNTKMFTTAAAFALLGTNYSFETRLYADGPFTNGNLEGNLNLVCEHDPTWNSTAFRSARTPLDHIAGKLHSLGLTNISGNVQCFGACAYDLGSSDSLSSRGTASHNSAAATAFLASLRAHDITVTGSAHGETNFTAPGTLLYTHHSSDLNYEGHPLKLDVACIPLLKVSHNVMADLLCRHLGWKLATNDSYAAGTREILRWLSSGAGLKTNGIVMNDGSGLSRGNRFSARQCVTLVRYMLGAYPSWETGLPIGCVDGTIRRRFCDTEAAGQVHAKTGSLRTSIALSGYLTNPYDHQRLLFSFIGNRNYIDQTATRRAIDEAVTCFAEPQIIQPTIALDGKTVTFNWPSAAGKRFRIQYKTSLADPKWQSVGDEITATSSTAAGADPAIDPTTQRFYRVIRLN